MTLTSKLENLADQIAALEVHKQQALWNQVAELNFRRGLYALSEQYQERLREQGELERSVEEILTELTQIREEIAEHDYPG